MPPKRGKKRAGPTQDNPPKRQTRSRTEPRQEEETEVQQKLPSTPQPVITASTSTENVIQLPCWDIISQLHERINELERMQNLKGDTIDDLDITVKQELKQKIWLDNFIDLGELITKNQMAEDSIELVKDAEGSLSFNQVKAKKSSLSIEQWSSAFLVFISIYVRKEPAAIQGLLAYAQLIRKAARDNIGSTGWRDYDEEFRRKKAADPSRPWGMIDSHVWLSTIAKGDKLSERVPKQTQPTCYRFNAVKGCQAFQCKFAHACSFCNKKGHPAYKCWSKLGDEKRQATNSKGIGPEKPKTPQNNSFRFGDK